jgi:hypothetical protein
MNDNMGHDERFDAAMRAHHGNAVAGVSPRMQAQLHQRRRAALAANARPAPAVKRFGWPLAASFAALFAVAIGLQVRQDLFMPHVATGAAMAAGDSDDDVDTILDENPDFYLWLDSSDARTLAME